MKYSSTQVAGAAALAASGAALHNGLSPKAVELLARALPANAPNGYTPQENNCPDSSPSIRSAASLSDQETDWLQKRRNATVEPMRDLLGRVNISGFDANQWFDDHRDNATALPNIGVAVSGGGYRAMLNGAGVVSAFDSRTPGSTDDGHLGGLLQSTTYLAGLSGGGWLVGSLYTNNYTSVSDIIGMDSGDEDSGSLWQFGNSILEGPEGDSFQLLDTAGYYTTLYDNVDDKSEAGFNTTITDYWGRALSFQLVNATNGGPQFTFSSIAEQDFFTSGDVPMPFLVADGRAPGEMIMPGNSTVFHFDPWELGTEDPTVYGFAPLKYVGTNFSDGEPRDDDACVTGFDNVGFVMGTSSSLFNMALTTINGTEAEGFFTEALQDAIANILTDVGDEDYDIADYPNPFYGYNEDTNPNAVSEQLTLVDGGEDLQNIPLHPLIQPYRAVDVIFAVDTSADTNETYPTNSSSANWPDGASLVATYRRSQSDIGNGTAFPAIPPSSTFLSRGLNANPTFFGCDSSNFTDNDNGNPPPPLIVYLPNAPYVYNSNVSTFQLSYNDTERNAIVANGYALATQGNATLDDNWGVCVGCAIMRRAWDREGTDYPSGCESCFDKYCWDGEVSNDDYEEYAPALKLQDEAVDVADSGAGRLGVGFAAVAAAAFMGAAALV